MCVYCETKDVVDWHNHHVKQLVPGYWVLSPSEVGLAKEDEDGFYAGCSGAHELYHASYIQIHVIVHVHKVRCGNQSAIDVKDTGVDGILDCLCDHGCRMVF